MPLFPTAPVRIQPYFGRRSRDRLIVTARALRAREDSFAKSGRWRAFRTMLAQFASHEVGGLSVELEIARPGGVSHRHQGITDKEGYVHFDIRLDPVWERGEHTAWETVRFHWSNRHGAQCVEGHVIAPGANVGLAVISDIDDTIIETGVTGDFRAIMRNWRRVLVEMPEERLLVPEADVFYTAIGGGLVAPESESEPGDRQRATRHPFFYVSSSPWNLFSYLVAYLGGRGLPLGPILLRDWGPNRATFGHESHGSHKRDAIAALIEQYPELQFALIGDDSQGDLAAYADIVVKDPKRVRAVFIRKLGEAFTAEEEAAKIAIEKAGVPLWLGEAYSEGKAFLATIGLLGDDNAKAVVEAIDDAKGAA